MKPTPRISNAGPSAGLSSEVPELALPAASDTGDPRIETEQPTWTARRVGRFLGGASAFSGVQGLAQGVGLLAGILWVRAMPVAEFGVYTLAGSVISLVAILSDLGAGSSLQHFFHMKRGNMETFGPYIDAVRGLRQILGMIAAPVPLLVFVMTASRGALSASSLILPAGFVLVTLFAQQETSVRLTVLRLLGTWKQVYRAELALSAIRLAGALLLPALRLATVSAALAANLAATIGAAALAAVGGVPRSKTRLTERREVMRYLLPILPEAIYYAFQGQAMVWLAAFTGGTTELAEIGALSRLGLLVAVPQSLAVNYLAPKLAGRHDDRSFRSTAYIFAVFLFLISCSLLLVAVVVPEAFLWVLGRPYAGLETELALVVAGATLSMMSAFFVQVNRLKAWTQSLWKIILLTVVGQVIYCLNVPLASSKAVLGLGLLANLLLTAGHLLVMLVGLARLGRSGRGKELGG